MPLRSTIQSTYCENGRYGYLLGMHHDDMGLVATIKAPARHLTARAARVVARDAVKALAAVNGMSMEVDLRRP